MNITTFNVTTTVLSKDEAAQLNPLVLAFVGDSVQMLYVRTSLALSHDFKSGALHNIAAGIVNAGAQARAYEKVKEMLEPDELAIYRRARNSKTGSSAKNASINDYRKATGIEAIFGYLYLTGQQQRLFFLLKMCGECDMLDAVPKALDDRDTD